MVVCLISTSIPAVLPWINNFFRHLRDEEVQAHNTLIPIIYWDWEAKKQNIEVAWRSQPSKSHCFLPVLWTLPKLTVLQLGTSTPHDGLSRMITWALVSSKPNKFKSFPLWCLSAHLGRCIYPLLPVGHRKTLAPPLVIFPL